jgi:hypothetical protein
MNGLAKGAATTVAVFAFTAACGHGPGSQSSSSYAATSATPEGETTTTTSLPPFGEGDIEVTIDGKDYPIDIPITCSQQMAGGGRDQLKAILVTWDPQGNVIQAMFGTSDGQTGYNYIQGDGNLRGDATLTRDGRSVHVEGHLTDVSGMKLGGLKPFTFDITCP